MSDTVEMWSDVRGAGERVVLLHGGFTDSRMFEGNLLGLSEVFEVHRVDRRAHGRTPDPGPLTHALMAADVVAHLERIGPSRLVGYSDGAVVALMVARARPDLVERLVLISGVRDRSGWLVLPDADAELPPAMADAYAEVSPHDREHFGVVARKAAAMATEDLGLGPDALAEVTCRTLVVTADDDLVALEHSLATYRGLPHAELAVVPGTSHGLLDEKPEECLRLVRTFLAGEAAPTLIPMRRASA